MSLDSSIDRPVLLNDSVEVLDRKNVKDSDRMRKNGRGEGEGGGTCLRES